MKNIPKRNSHFFLEVEGHIFNINYKKSTVETILSTPLIAELVRRSI